MTALETSKHLRVQTGSFALTESWSFSTATAGMDYNGRAPR